MFSLFVKRASNVPVGVRELEGCKPAISPLTTKLISLFMIRVCKDKSSFCWDLQSLLDGLSVKTRGHQASYKVIFILPDPLIFASCDSLLVSTCRCWPAFVYQRFYSVYVTFYIFVRLSFQILGLNLEPILHFPIRNPV